jgi:hypothetical protein
VLIRTCTYFIRICLCAQPTQKTAAVKATADQKSAQKQAKADTDAATAKETSEESKDAEKAGGEEAAEDSEKEEEDDSAETSAATRTVPDAESSDDGDETGRCVVCKGSKSIGKVSGSL